MSQSHKKDVGAIVRKSGVSFRVWAPFANSVTITGSFNNWGESPLASEGDGYWWAMIDNAEVGQEYKYLIRSGDKTLLKNDPRALHITTAAGNSVIADTHFDWGDDTFIPVPAEEQVIYELHVGTFFRPDPTITGTFEDVAAKLDHLADLGVTTLELMPITSMSMEREWWGYTPNHMYAIENLYGGRHQFLELVKAAHERGMGVILDVVFNHFGPDNNMDLWQFDGWSQDNKGGIYFYNDWRANTPWGETRPDYGRTEVQQYLLDSVRMWMHDCRLDGLRVDSTIFIRNAKGHNDDPDTDLPEGWHLLQKINSEVRKINPVALTIGEDVGGNDYITKSIGEGGAGFLSQWEVTFPQALREALRSSDPNSINLTGICSELGKRYNDDAFQRVIYGDSHDSAANGSARLNEVVSPGKSNSLFARKQTLLAAALLLTTPGIPMIFQGQEFIQPGSFNDWEGLDWENAERYGGITQAFRDLIALRRNIHGVTTGLTGKSVNVFQVDEDNKVLAYHRWKNGGPKDDVIVVINFGDRLHPTYNMSFPRNGTWRVRYNGNVKDYSDDFKGVEVDDVVVESGSGTLVLPPSSALIFSRD